MLAPVSHPRLHRWVFGVAAAAFFLAGNAAHSERDADSMEMMQRTATVAAVSAASLQTDKAPAVAPALSPKAPSMPWWLIGAAVSPPSISTIGMEHAEELAGRLALLQESNGGNSLVVTTTSRNASIGTAPPDLSEDAVLHDNVWFVFGILILVFFLAGSVETVQFLHTFLFRGSEPSKEQNVAPAEKKHQTMWTIIGLNSGSFYTGFLSSTWLPFLLAMEGSRLMQGNQALFMGVAKLIYGGTILLNPLIGLVGDRGTSVSYALSRRFFMRIGIAVAGLGIFLCLVSAPQHDCYLFLIGLFVWRLGEGFKDVTTEAISPELIHKDQFEVSSATKASLFLIGGVVGYAMIACMRHVHWSWLYDAYLIMMLVFGVPPIISIGNIATENSVPRRKTGQNFLMSMINSYIVPSRLKGGFPRACLCTFLFSFGGAPIFFIMLMIRDLIGLQDYYSLQMHFSFISIDFFLSAAIAAILSPILFPTKKKNADGKDTVCESLRAKSFRLTAVAVSSFGVSVCLMPLIGAPTTLEYRIGSFYVLAFLLGISFGSIYSRFQDCTWQLLPPDADIANAMGFAAMCKLVGAGLGNFYAGCVLNFFAIVPQATATMTKGSRPGDRVIDTLTAYSAQGYVTMCTSCALVLFLAGYMTYGIPDHAEQDAPLAKKAADAAEATPERTPEPAGAS